MELLMFALKVSALGFGTVCVILYGLSIIMELQSKLYKIEKPKVQETKQVAASIEASPVAATIVQEDEEELIAVIAAAIAACGHQIVIKNITRIHGSNGPAWSSMGRSEAMNLRQIG